MDLFLFPLLDTLGKNENVTFDIVFQILVNIFFFGEELVKEKCPKRVLTMFTENEKALKR